IILLLRHSHPPRAGSIAAMPLRNNAPESEPCSRRRNRPSSLRVKRFPFRGRSPYLFRSEGTHGSFVILSGSPAFPGRRPVPARRRKTVLVAGKGGRHLL